MSIRIMLKCDRCKRTRQDVSDSLEIAEKIEINHYKDSGTYRFLHVINENSNIQDVPEGNYEKAELKQINTRNETKIEVKKSEIKQTNDKGIKMININIIPESNIYCVFKCNKCGYLTEKIGKSVEKAKTHSFSNQHFNGTNTCDGIFEYYTPVGMTISDKYNNEKLDKIKNSTCKTCKKVCTKSPEMLAICQVESMEYRMRMGNFNVSSTGNNFDENIKDVKGVIIENTPVRVEDIRRLFIARWDTYSLYDPKDAGKESPKAPESYQQPTDDVIMQSLLGHISIGFRPIDPETGIYRWICYDIDNKHCDNPKEIVDLVVKYLKDWYNLNGYIELSGSKDSYHVWIFLEPTDKETVYKFDASFKERCDKSINQSIDKRVVKGEGQFIKCPYNINIKNNNRSMFIDGVDLSKIQPERLPVIEVSS